MYVIVVCGNCRGVLISRVNSKSCGCSYCGKRVNLALAKKIGRARTAREALETAQYLKQQKASQSRTHRKNIGYGFSKGKSNS